MSRQKIKTMPNLADTSIKHLEAIKNGKEHLSSWQYNVADHLKDKSVEEIKEILRNTAHSFTVCMENFIGDFNIGTLIRNANAFNCMEVFYIGNKKFDKRGAVGVYNYTPVTWLSSIDELISLQEKYTIVGIDNIPGSVPMKTYQWQPNTLMVFGEEGVGLTPAMQAFCKDIVAIEMYGSVRSLNCGTASGIVMYDFVSKVS